MMVLMTTDETHAASADNSDWYDTTPIETDERENDRRAGAARHRLDAGVGMRLTADGNGYYKVADTKQDVDRIGRVLRASTFGSGPEPADVDPDDIAAALQLFAPARKNLDLLESHVMGIARRQRLSWRVIAEPLGLQSPQAAAQRWERLTGSVAPAVWALRQRVVAAVQEGSVTRSEAKVFVGGSEGRTVVLQLSAHGPAETRRDVAERLIEALRAAGLSIADEGSHSATDMAAYLADGGTAEVYDPAERSTTPS